MVGCHGMPKKDRKALTSKPSSTEVQEIQVSFSYTVISRPAWAIKVFVFETLNLIRVVLMHMGTGVILWDLDSLPFVTFLKESDFHSFTAFHHRQLLN